jgi:hypothetical protein
VLRASEDFTELYLFDLFYLYLSLIRNTSAGVPMDFLNYKPWRNGKVRSDFE